MLLYVPEGMRLEPDSTWPDGTPSTASAHIAEDAARRALAILGEQGFIERAVRFHSERRPSPESSPPAGSTTERPGRSPEPHIAVEVTVNDDDWYRYRLMTCSLGDEGRSITQALQTAISGEGGELLGQLAAQL